MGLELSGRGTCQLQKRQLRTRQRGQQLAGLIPSTAIVRRPGDHPPGTVGALETVHDPYRHGRGHQQTGPHLWADGGTRTPGTALAPAHWGMPPTQRDPLGQEPSELSWSGRGRASITSWTTSRHVKRPSTATPTWKSVDGSTTRPRRHRGARRRRISPRRPWALRLHL